MKIIVLNGPPRSGKDTAGFAVVAGVQQQLDAGTSVSPLNWWIERRKMSDNLKLGAHALMGFREDADFFEAAKDEPQDELMGWTPRQLYTALDEEFFKPRFGKGARGHSFVNAVRNMLKLHPHYLEYVIVCETGFLEELEPLVEAFGADNILLLRLYRPGCSFPNDHNDRREYIEHSKVLTLMVENDTEKMIFERECIRLASLWLGLGAPAGCRRVDIHA